MTQRIIRTNLPDYNIRFGVFDFTFHSISGSLRHLTRHPMTDHDEVRTLEGCFKIRLKPCNVGAVRRSSTHAHRRRRAYDQDPGLVSCRKGPTEPCKANAMHIGHRGARDGDPGGDLATART